MPPGVFESIASLLDHSSHVNWVDFRRAIFIFLSNAGGIEVSKVLEDQMSDGKYREQTSIHDYERILEAAAYNVDGGLQNAGIIKSSLIDHFVPFLPLEKRHVMKCIRREFERLGKIPTDEEVEWVASIYIYFFFFFFPLSFWGAEDIDKCISHHDNNRFVATTYVSYVGKFAKYGCKRIDKKVAVMVEMSRESYTDDESPSDWLAE